MKHHRTAELLLPFRVEAAKSELDAAFTQHKREAATALQEAREQGGSTSARATRLETELDAARTSEAAAQQRATAAEARSRELNLVRPVSENGLRIWLLAVLADRLGTNRQPS